MISLSGPPATQRARLTLCRLNAEIRVARSTLAGLGVAIADVDREPRDCRLAALEAENKQLQQEVRRVQRDADIASDALQVALQRADRDPLTGLPDRWLLFDRFAQAIAASKRRESRLALLFVDLDRFKQVNDTLGHSAGDAVLQHAARGLVSAVREADTVSRHGGDEFVLLLTDIGLAAEAGAIALKASAAVAAPCDSHGAQLRMSCSIGISIYPDDGEAPARLIACADRAMYEAKSKRLGGFVFWREGLDLPPP